MHVISGPHSYSPHSPQIQCWVKMNGQWQRKTFNTLLQWMDNDSARHLTPYCMNGQWQRKTFNTLLHHSTLKKGEGVCEFWWPTSLNTFYCSRRQILEFLPTVLSGSVWIQLISGNRYFSCLRVSPMSSYARIGVVTSFVTIVYEKWAYYLCGEK